jgi:glyoxylase-like metal-dependent hydrolase (beta-lactamase superfamily II)
VHELQAGLWHWQAPHPDWTSSARWPRQVSSYAIDDGERLILFDPLAVPSALLDRATQREPVIVLTAPWHERETQQLVAQLDCAVFVPRPDTAEDLVHKFGVTLEQAGSGSPDVAWLLAAGDGRLYAAGDRLPFGIEALLGREHNDLVLWVERQRCVLCGDTLVDFGQGFEINRWLRGGVTRDQVVERLEPLLARPVEHVLPTHGAPTDRAALARAISWGR